MTPPLPVSIDPYPDESIASMLRRLSTTTGIPVHTLHPYGVSGRLTDRQTLTVRAGGRAGVPAGADSGIVNVTAIPYAAASPLEVRNASTSPTHAAMSSQLTTGT